jgi:hypothetical protein
MLLTIVRLLIEREIETTLARGTSREHAAVQARALAWCAARELRLPLGALDAIVSRAARARLGCPALPPPAHETPAVVIPRAALPDVAAMLDACARVAEPETWQPRATMPARPGAMRVA